MHTQVGAECMGEHVRTHHPHLRTVVAELLLELLYGGVECFARVFQRLFQSFHSVTRGAKWPYCDAIYVEHIDILLPIPFTIYLQCLILANTQFHKKTPPTSTFLAGSSLR